MTDASKEAVRVIQKRIGSTPFPDGFQGIADDASAMIDAQAARIAELEAELENYQEMNKNQIAIIRQADKRGDGWKARHNAGFCKIPKQRWRDWKCSIRLLPKMQFHLFFLPR